MTLENKYNRGTHGDSSHMLSTVVLSNENQTCRGWEAPTSIGGGGCHQINYRICVIFIMIKTRNNYLSGMLPFR